MAGKFYPADPRELRAQVLDLLAAVPAEPRPARAAIVPHAALIYSGACAARVFARLALPSTVVILAPNHTGMRGAGGGASAWDRGAFDTPLGRVPIASRFLATLEASTPLVAHDPIAHSREHAVEVELPFLVHLAPHAGLAPLILAWDDWDRCRALAEGLAQAVARWDGPVLLLASSDMTHYESAEAARRKDEQVLAMVRMLDGKGLLAVCRRDNVTMCGRGPAATILEAARLLGATYAEVVDYRHSGMVTGDDDRVVAYAGVVIP